MSYQPSHITGFVIIPFLIMVLKCYDKNKIHTYSAKLLIFDNAVLNKNA